MKNILKILLLLFVTLILYILYSNQKIDGIWIETYSFNKKYSLNTNYGNVITANKGKVKRYGLNENEDEQKYYIFNNHFYISFYRGRNIEILTKDSMIISNNGDNLIYKKVKSDLKNYTNFNFINKMYQLKSKEFTDTIYFTKQFVFLKIRNYQMVDLLIK